MLPEKHFLLSRKELALVDPDNPVLRYVCDEVDETWIPELKFLADSMIGLMRERRGLVLAAPQIGLPIQLFCFCDPDDRRNIKTVINPKVLHRSIKKSLKYEGCLSLPGLTALIERPRKIVVQYTELSGAKSKFYYHEPLSGVFQSGFDHLNGILLIDKMFNSDKIKYKSLMNKFGVTPSEQRLLADGNGRDISI